MSEQQGVPSRSLACCTMAVVNGRQQAIAQTAAQLVGARAVEVNGRRLTFDCAGVARAVYLSQGVDIYTSGREAAGANGVRLIYRHVQKHGRLHQGPEVHPGDLVFFHNTWDYNNDGLVNDPLTHVGIVETVEADGTVVFISRVSAGVERYRMNLLRPNIHRTDDGHVLNDYIRRKRWYDARQTQYLTGELFAAFGTLLY